MNINSQLDQDVGNRRSQGSEDTLHQYDAFDNQIISKGNPEALHGPVYGYEEDGISEYNHNVQILDKILHDPDSLMLPRQQAIAEDLPEQKFSRLLSEIDKTTKAYQSNGASIGSSPDRSKPDNARIKPLIFKDSPTKPEQSAALYGTSPGRLIKSVYSQHSEDILKSDPNAGVESEPAVLSKWDRKPLSEAKNQTQKVSTLTLPSQDADVNQLGSQLHYQSHKRNDLPGINISLSRA